MLVRSCSSGIRCWRIVSCTRNSTNVPHTFIKISPQLSFLSTTFIPASNWMLLLIYHNTEYDLMCIETQQDLFSLLKQKISILRYLFHLTLILFAECITCSKWDLWQFIWNVNLFWYVSWLIKELSNNKEYGCSEFFSGLFFIFFVLSITVIWIKKILYNCWGCNFQKK